MIEIIDGLYLGGDESVAKGKERGYAILACCKDGPNSHRSMLKYDGRSAPKDKNYYFVERGKQMALNLIDPDDPAWVPEPLIDAGLDFIKRHREAGDKVLIHCNAGVSRGPTVTLLYLRTIGEMPHDFIRSERVFRTLYPKYDPGQGMRQFARSHWSQYGR